MSIVLSHTSMPQYWQHTQLDHCRLPEVPRAKRLIAKPPKEEDYTYIPFWLDRPLHLLCADDSLRRRSKNTVWHIWSKALPKGAILDTGSGFYVSSPEFYFVQMANTLSLIELILVGFELCGTYRISNNTLHTRPSLTTVERLKTFIAQTGKARGLKKATHASQYLLDNSASPMETILTLLLCLPYRLGGYGIASPVLNCAVDIFIKGTFMRSYVCDLFWPKARLALEYDSNKHHTGADKIAYDSIRRSDLATQGISVISVTNSQIKNPAEMDKLARFSATQTGKKIRYNAHIFLQRNLELRKELFQSLSRG